MKRTAFSSLLLAIILLIPDVSVFASTETSPSIPEPDNISSIENLELFNDYSEILKEFEQYRQKKFKNDYFDHSLSLPEVKQPDNANKQATEKFKEAYKDLEEKIKDKSFGDSSSLPDDAEFKKFLEEFKASKIKEFKGTKLDEDISVKDLLKSQLDMNALWNMNSIKKKMQISDDMSEFLSNTPKPDGWNSVKNGKKAPSMNSWLSSGSKAEGYGQSSLLDVGKDVLGSVSSKFSDLKEKFSEGIKNVKDKIDDILNINLKEKWNNFKSNIKSKISSFFTDK